MHQMLTYVGYTGKNFWNKRKRGPNGTHIKRDKEQWIEYEIPVIISQEIFQAAQGQLSRNKALARRNRKNEYLFTGGRLRCGHCGRTMSGYKSAGKSRKYRCNSKTILINPARRCHGLSLNADTTEERVWQAIERVLSNPELIAVEVARQGAGSGELKAEVMRETGLIEFAFAKCDKEEKRWSAAYAAEVITLQELKGYRLEIKARRENLEAQKAELERKLESIALAVQKTESLIVYCERVRGSLNKLDWEEKRLALEALDVRVTCSLGQPLNIEASIPLLAGGEKQGSIVPSLTGCDMQRYWRDSRLLTIGPISNEMARNFIAMDLGLPRSY